MKGTGNSRWMCNRLSVFVKTSTATIPGFFPFFKMMTESIDKNRTCPTCGAKTTPVCLPFSGGGHVGSLIDDLEGIDSPPGYIFVGANGLILNADPASAALLGSVQIALIERPFTLFIRPGDLADFFIHRNALFATHEEQNFEIKLRKKDRSFFHAKLKCTFIRNWKRNTDCMRISIRDYTRRRQALDQLGYRQDIENIASTITTRLIRCPARDIDASLSRELKTLAMFTEVERTYLAVFDETVKVLTLTHEWCASGVIPIQRDKKSIDLDQIPGLKRAVFSGKHLQVNDVGDEPGDWALELDRFHMDGTRAFAYFILREKDVVHGIIGYDSGCRQDQWDQEVVHLFQFAGQAFLNAVSRREDESAWRTRHDQAPKRSDQRIASPGPPAGGPAAQPGNTPPVKWDIPLEIEEITETGE
ncbi:MAG: hypothetical protein DSY89_03445, partial [Deltaproteobacteria bacterium]